MQELSQNLVSLVILNDLKTNWEEVVIEDVNLGKDLIVDADVVVISEVVKNLPVYLLIVRALQLIVIIRILV